MSETRAHVFFSGLVQGVWFRAFTQQTAMGLDLCGWVRNLPDGRVEAVFEGERDLIEQALSACKVGPPSARVDDIKITWEEPRGEAPFSARH